MYKLNESGLNSVSNLHDTWTETVFVDISGWRVTYSILPYFSESQFASYDGRSKIVYFIPINILFIVNYWIRVVNELLQTLLLVLTVLPFCLRLIPHPLHLKQSTCIGLPFMLTHGPLEWQEVKNIHVSTSFSERIKLVDKNIKVVLLPWHIIIIYHSGHIWQCAVW